MRVLVTGNAGFIGFHIPKRLLESDDAVIGMDMVNDYYDGQSSTRGSLPPTRSQRA